MVNSDMWRPNYGMLVTFCKLLQTEYIIIHNPSRCIDFARDIVITRSRSGSYEEHFTPEPKKRTPEMRFAVGMVVKNVQVDLTGVIIGWLDTKTLANVSRFARRMLLHSPLRRLAT
ncbi:uncharacterized protein LOC113563098 [Ooceraea biroi]|nr:uncharacterized protein LOC113563098 [Ooceraea biroi]